VNLNTDDPIGARNRAILYGLATLVVIGIVVGVSLGWLTSRAVDSTGIDDVKAPDNQPGVTENDPIDDFTASSSPTHDTDETTPTTPPTETNEPPPTKPTKTHKPRNHREPTLTASPMTADTYEDISLSGRFPGLGAGVALQVERKEGGVWTSFPVSMSTDSGGTYSITVSTGHSGPNPFRVTAETGESTPAVIVEIT
jgi:cytoskeletal protein RodZ